ncbi:MAG: aminoacyl-tRNA hydrolase [Candidatus Portnoybacteria bacterium]|nr:aminoacyl-tRNA hydrolase [Candidatus Portnoybacteria bacterium]
MKIIFGLGNPGQKYERTRHNFGFMALDYIQKNLGGFSGWREKDKSQIAEGQIKGEQIILAKPQTFMNLSGSAVKELADFYRTQPEDIWIIHDDFDLPLGLIRISKNSSGGGHNGVKSIIEALGNKEFIRFRLGIHPIGKTFISTIMQKITSLEKFVLKNFSKEEIPAVQETIKKAAQAIETACESGIESAMNRFN